MADRGSKRGSDRSDTDSQNNNLTLGPTEPHPKRKATAAATLSDNTLAAGTNLRTYTPPSRVMTPRYTPLDLGGRSDYCDSDAEFDPSDTRKADALCSPPSDIWGVAAGVLDSTVSGTPEFVAGCARAPSPAALVRVARVSVAEPPVPHDLGPVDATLVGAVSAHLAATFRWMRPDEEYCHFVDDHVKPQVLLQRWLATGRETAQLPSRKIAIALLQFNQDHLEAVCRDPSLVACLRVASPALSASPAAIHTLEWAVACNLVDVMPIQGAPRTNCMDGAPRGTRHRHSPPEW
jgi:hypothetical protein